MITITEIESALKRINPNTFQEFCNHLLYYKFNPNSIEPYGSVVSKEKSRKGIPDCYFLNDQGQFTFIEYTTQEKIIGSNRFFKKLKDDIQNCFNFSKTGIESTKIEKVILCFTDRISPKESEQLFQLVKQNNKSCQLLLFGIRELGYIAMDYPPLGKYLGLDYSTDQILTPSDFIKKYERGKLATPLSNKFIGRNSELESGLEKLNNSEVILVNGESGTGKSKYAIELCRQYTNLNTSYSFLCIGNNGLGIWNDLKTYIHPDKDYIILIDDANRIAKNFEWILTLLNDDRQGKLKLVVTVRDYALQEILKISENFQKDEIQIKPLDEDTLIQILKSTDFNIQNQHYIQRIIDISIGNARLAIMCAKVAIDNQNLLSLNDASQIFEEYFSSTFNEIELLNDSQILMVLALISFFGKINREDRNLCDKLFALVDFTEEFFWSSCYALNESELVDLYENQIVKISDQVLSTYIFYKVIIDKEILSFQFFLANFIEYHYRIIDTLNSVLKTFSYKKIEQKIKNQIFAQWDVIKSDSHQDILKFLNLFWSFLPDQILAYAKRYVDGLPEPNEKVYRYKYEMNEFSGGTESIIDLLSRFKNFKKNVFLDSLDILFLYALKIPSKIPSLVYTIKVKYSFSKEGYLEDYHVQHIVLDYLIAGATNGKDIVVFENILNELIPHYLKIQHEESESDGKKLTLYTFIIGLSDSIKQLRKKIFDYLFLKAKDNKQIINKVLFELPIFDYQHSDEIFNFDKEFIYILIDAYLNPESFDDCIIVHEISVRFNRLNKPLPEELTTKFNSEVYQLINLLKNEREYIKKGISYAEEIEIEKNEFKTFCRDYGKTEYLQLFEYVRIFIEKDKNAEWRISQSLTLILTNLAESDYNLFNELIISCISEYNFNIDYYRIFISYFRFHSKKYSELYETIRKAPLIVKLAFHYTLNSACVTVNKKSQFYGEIKDEVSKFNGRNYLGELSFIESYNSSNSIQAKYEEILDILNESFSKGNILLVRESYLEKCIELNLPINKITSLYTHLFKSGDHFDYKKELLKKIMEKNSSVLIQLLDEVIQKGISYRELEHENFDFIWDLPDHDELLISMIELFNKKNLYPLWERSINAFFPKHNNNKYGEKPIRFIHSMITKFSSEKAIMEVIFNVICYSYPDKKADLLRLFLQQNTDINIFKRLELIKRTGIYTGSRVPYIESDMKEWGEVLNILESFPNRMDFLEHKEYVKTRIQYCKEDKARTIKREFMTDFL